MASRKKKFRRPEKHPMAFRKWSGFRFDKKLGVYVGNGEPSLKVTSLFNSTHDIPEDVDDWIFCKVRKFRVNVRQCLIFCGRGNPSYPRKICNVVVEYCWERGMAWQERKGSWVLFN